MSAPAKRGRRRWRPSGPLQPWQLDDATARRMKATYDRDTCVCGHYRIEHKGTGCTRCRRCCGYAWAGAKRVEA